MKQLAYRILYDRRINPVIRSVNKGVASLLPNVVRIPPSGVMKFRIPSRKLTMHTNQSSCLTKMVYWDGYENFEYSVLFIQLIKKIASFWDVGSNIGYYSLLAAAENPSCRISAFEPSSGPLHFLRMNVAANGFKQIRIEALALAETSGTLEFHEARNPKYQYLQHDLSGDGSAADLDAGRTFKMNQVRSISMDEYLDLNDENGVDLIKMDTEGTEHSILLGGHNVLTDHKPIVICEILFDKIENDLEDLMKSYGYEFFIPEGQGLKHVPGIRRKTDNGVRNCFFVHPTKRYLIEEYVV
jgi:FkbM family methyltransferase